MHRPAAGVCRLLVRGLQARCAADGLAPATGRHCAACTPEVLLQGITRFKIPMPEQASKPAFALVEQLSGLVSNATQQAARQNLLPELRRFKLFATSIQQQICSKLKRFPHPSCDTLLRFGNCVLMQSPNAPRQSKCSLAALLAARGLDLSFPFLFRIRSNAMGNFRRSHVADCQVTLALAGQNML